MGLLVVYVCIVLLFSCVVCVVCCLVSLLLGLVIVMMLYRAHTTQLHTLMGGGRMLITSFLFCSLVELVASRIVYVV